jgi:hypothetical protein
MQQLELFEFRRDCLFDSKNQIAHYFDILKETKDTISYAEHIEPNSEFAIAGMSYEEYVDINKDELKGLTYDQILNYLNNSKKEERLENYKKLLKFRNITFKADLFTWNDISLISLNLCLSLRHK